MRNFVVAGFGLGCPTSFSATLTARTCRRLGSAGEAQVGDVAACQLCRAVGTVLVHITAGSGPAGSCCWAQASPSRRLPGGSLPSDLV